MERGGERFATAWELSGCGSGIGSDARTRESSADTEGAVASLDQAEDAVTEQADPDGHENPLPIRLAGKHIEGFPEAFHLTRVERPGCNNEESADDALSENRKHRSRNDFSAVPCSGANSRGCFRQSACHSRFARRNRR